MILFEDERYKVSRIDGKKGNRAKPGQSLVIAIDKTTGQRIDPLSLPDYIQAQLEGAQPC